MVESMNQSPVFIRVGAVRSRTSSTRISAAAPGVPSSPASLSSQRISHASRPVSFSRPRISSGLNASMWISG